MITAITKQTEILIVGLGVIGGGYARALSSKGYRVHCITSKQEDIDYALSEGMIRDGRTTPDADYIQSADLVICAEPFPFDF